MYLIALSHVVALHIDASNVYLPMMCLDQLGRCFVLLLTALGLSKSW
jgi:hypothetical protein